MRTLFGYDPEWLTSGVLRREGLHLWNVSRGSFAGWLAIHGYIRHAEDEVGRRDVMFVMNPLRAGAGQNGRVRQLDPLPRKISQRQTDRGTEEQRNRVSGVR